MTEKIFTEFLEANPDVCGKGRRADLMKGGINSQVALLEHWAMVGRPKEALKLWRKFKIWQHEEETA